MDNERWFVVVHLKDGSVLDLTGLSVDEAIAKCHAAGLANISVTVHTIREPQTPFVVVLPPED